MDVFSFYLLKPEENTWMFGLFHFLQPKDNTWMFFFHLLKPEDST
jgi:hypothetical protein